MNEETLPPIDVDNFDFRNATATDLTRLAQAQQKLREQQLEQQQQNLLRYPDRKLLMLNIDAGGVQSRKILDRLLAAERAPAAAQAVAA